MMEDEIKRKLEHGVAKFYQIAGPAFSSTRRGPWDVMRLLVERVKPGERVVDVGAGNGRLADLLPKGVGYLGIEPSPTLRASSKYDASQSFPSLEYARGRLQYESRKITPVISAEARIQKSKTNNKNPMDHDLTNGDFQINNQALNDEDEAVKIVIDGLLPALDLSDCYADAVACIAVLHHIPSAEQRRLAVAELRRILKPGGLLLCTVWNLRAKRFLSWLTFKTAWLRIGGIVGGESGDLMYPWHAQGADDLRYVHAFTLREFNRLFKTKDWIIENIGAYDNNAWQSVVNGRNLVALVRRR